MEDEKFFSLVFFCEEFLALLVLFVFLWVFL